MLTRVASFFLLLAACFTRPALAERVKLTVLATTDLHGNIYPIDYFTDRPANRGLAKIATLIRAERAANPNTLLVDCGDTIQGTPLEYVYQTFRRSGSFPLKLTHTGAPLERDPMMLAMNAIGYDAMVVGNHEFNFGWRNLDRARSDAKFPWLSANTKAPKPFAGYLLKTIAGVKVAVIGITTPSIPSWERPDNYTGYSFDPAQVAVEKAMAELRPQKPDLVLVAAHAGLGADPKTGEKRDSDAPGENEMYDVAMRVPGIDAIVFGHTHAEVPELRLNGVLLNQPKNWGISLGELTFELDSKPGGGFAVTRKSSRVIPVTAQTAADEEILRIGRPYHEMAQKYLSTPVAESSEALDGRLGRVEDTALVDAVQAVQLHYTGADVSFTSLFNPRVSVPKGQVTVRQLAALYLYDNELYKIEGTGKMVKDALENSARFYLSCNGASCSKGPLINTRVIGFNYDMAEGVEYEIDLTQPEGQRIRNLKWKGRPLGANEKLTIAVNNYRAGGSAGYDMFRNAKILWRSSDDIRDLMISYFTEKKSLPAKPSGNWHVVPPEAQQTLEREAQADAQRANTF